MPDRSSHPIRATARRRGIAPASFAYTVVLGALTALPPLGIDMGLPALHGIGTSLGTTAARASLTLSVFLAAFAGAQLVLGPLSDRIGRRPVLLGGLLLFAAAGLGCATAGSIEALLVWRAFQGAAAAAGTVMAFAMVRDQFEGTAARAKLSYVATVLPVAPMIAPTLGSLVLLAAGWRGIYAALAAGGLLLLAVIVSGVPETYVPQRRPAGVLRAYAIILLHRQAGGFALANAASFAMLFAWVSASPLVLMGEARVSAPVYGGLFACISGGLLVGAWINGRLAARGVGARLPLLLGLAGSVAASAAALALVALAPVSPETLVPVLVLAMMGRGLAGPNMTHATLEPMPALAGAASAVLGFLSMAAGAAISAIVASLYPLFGSLAVMGAMTACAALALLVGSFAGRHYAA